MAKKTHSGGTVAASAFVRMQDAGDATIHDQREKVEIEPQNRVDD